MEGNKKMGDQLLRLVQQFLDDRAPLQDKSFSWQAVSLPPQNQANN